ncbi:MAG: Signal transduction histidine kinase CheA [uncultured Solirubrobacteraceae bacterium]|uniref:Chemotaxis protein CheA n=1 Tax=uncultured Solirubrobacteraceae bacterium TaxID=1162706 RepID=A0A6J4SC89_9ACTN|nr:MAG: Signal transduction histidine kinase CheA [uncultured Solirubrobacteraceae bacterium]
MENSDYLPMFLAESREHLQELNLAIIRIEEVSDDHETLDEIFRIAHSLKGMSATMGFAGMAALTHEMEDVLELIRQRRGAVGRDAIDVLLACLDALEASVDSIETEGVEGIRPEPLIERLRGLIRDRTPEQTAERTAIPVAPDDLAERSAGRRVVTLAAHMTEDALMPGVRAFMVIQSMGDHGEVIGSVPAPDRLDGFDGRVVHVWIASDADPEVLIASASRVPDIGEAHCAEVSLEAAAIAEGDAIEAGEAAPRADAPPAKKHAAASTVRVDAERLDQLMHYIGELVLHRTEVEAVAAQADVPGLSQAVQNLTRTSQALQAMVMQVRMVPVEAVFLRFPRLARDLSAKLGKQVDLTLIGQDTEMDRTVVEALGDPLVHLVRNCLDHGLEPAAERVAAGKPPTGTLEISARHAGGNVIITVRDDGRGIDPRKVAAKAVQRGLIPPEAADSIDMARASELLFTAGFSTAETTSDISGRGVGMDAVRSAIRELGGEVLMTSELGQGTTAQIRLPLTLAIINALLVEVDDQPVAIPIERVERTVRLADHAVRSVAGERMLVMSDGVLPIIEAADRFGHGGGPEPAHAVLVRGHDRRIAVSVSKLIGQRELVTRPLPADVAEQAGLSGGAVLSNGQIALIADCDALFEIARPLVATAA